MSSRSVAHFGTDKYRADNYHIENTINGGKQIEFSAESNKFEKKIKSGKKWNVQ